MFADPAGDQLRVLGAEIDDEDGMTGGPVPRVVPGGTRALARWAVGSDSCHDGGVHGATRGVTRAIWTAVAAVLIGVGSSAPASATIPPEATEDNVYLDLERSVTECISAMPKPGCGREPVDSGDRGGWQQFLVFGVLMSAMAAIGVRVAFAIRSRDRNPIPNPDNSPTL